MPPSSDMKPLTLQRASCAILPLEEGLPPNPERVLIFLNIGANLQPSEWFTLEMLPSGVDIVPLLFCTHLFLYDT